MRAENLSHDLQRSSRIRFVGNMKIARHEVRAVREIDADLSKFLDDLDDASARIRRTLPVRGNDSCHDQK